MSGSVDVLLHTNDDAARHADEMSCTVDILSHTSDHMMLLMTCLVQLMFPSCTKDDILNTDAVLVFRWCARTRHRPSQSQPSAARKPMRPSTIQQIVRIRTPLRAERQSQQLTQPKTIGHTPRPPRGPSQG